MPVARTLSICRAETKTHLGARPAAKGLLAMVDARAHLFKQPQLLVTSCLDRTLQSDQDDYVVLAPVVRGHVDELNGFTLLDGGICTGMENGFLFSRQ